MPRFPLPDTPSRGGPHACSDPKARPPPYMPHACYIDMIPTLKFVRKECNQRIIIRTCTAIITIIGLPVYARQRRHRDRAYAQQVETCMHACLQYSLSPPSIISTVWLLPQEEQAMWKAATTANVLHKSFLLLPTVSLQKKKSLQTGRKAATLQPSPDGSHVAHHELQRTEYAWLAHFTASATESTSTAVIMQSALYLLGRYSIYILK
jgi:hypothetical protein